jgi:Cu-Zn family superoxide dismutase
MTDSRTAAAAADPLAAKADAKGGGGGATATKTAVATMEPSKAPGDDDVAGTVTFTSAGGGDKRVKMRVSLSGLKPNGKHGFHIHEKGDLSDPKLTSAGPHFNPTKSKHGGPEGEHRHAGDLGNITADAKGNAKAEITAHGVSIDGETDGIVGRSIIVHAKADDLKTDPSGDSGDRIAGGVIQKSGGGSAAAEGGRESGDVAEGDAAPAEGDARPAAGNEAGGDTDATATEPQPNAATGAEGATDIGAGADAGAEPAGATDAGTGVEGATDAEGTTGADAETDLNK